MKAMLEHDEKGPTPSHQPISALPPWPIVFFGERIKGSGTILDLSIEGCIIQSTFPLRPGTHLTAQIMLSQSTDHIFINEATVSWVKTGTCQLRFTDISEESRGKIQTILSKTQTGIGDSALPYCTRCGSEDVKRTPRKGLMEHIQSFFFWYPFRCRSCGDRFLYWQWGVRYLKNSEER